MKAVARLVWSYFTGSVLTRTMTLIGVALISVDIAILVTQPHSGDTLWIAIVGLIALFVGSSWMPVIVGRLAGSHGARIMPGARIKLLASALITVLLVSLPVGIVAPAAVVSDTSSLAEVMKNPEAQAFVLRLAAISFTSAMVFVGWMHVALWLLTSKRNLKGLVATLILILLLTLLPVRDLKNLDLKLDWNLQQLAVTWLVFGAAFLLWPRFQGGRFSIGRPFEGVSRALAGRTAGREFDVLLGTSNPWVGVLALAAPLLIMAHFIGTASAVWLNFLAIFSTVSGAVSGQIPGRSRALWLRGSWSRASLFSAVERSVWRHNSYTLGALSLVFVGIGLYAGFPWVLMAYGLPLLVLGSALSTYLGLAATQGLRWTEVVCGISVMFAPMLLVKLMSSVPTGFVTVFAMELVLFALVFGLREVARRRWLRIDWVQCRPDRVMIIRGA